MKVGRFPAWVSLVARFTLSGILLAVVARVLDVGSILARLGELSAAWIVLGLGLSVVQVLMLAWRWRYTAARLGIDLPMGAAMREYYLGILLNQVLPGGVAGDVSRAWRHARSPAPGGPAVRAVVLERASAQVIMTAAAVVSIAMLPEVFGGDGGGGATGAGVGRGVAWALALALVVAIGLLFAVRALRVVARRWDSGSLAGRFRDDARQALFADRAFAFHLVTGALVVASYIGMYLIAARAVGVETPTLLLLPLVAPVLMTMLLPITVAGWGVRESAAAALWGVVGLTPEDGVAIAVAYGVLVLVSSVPGVWPLMRIPTEGRGRTAGRPPDGSGDTPGAGPRTD